MCDIFSGFRVGMSSVPKPGSQAEKKEAERAKARAKESAESNIWNGGWTAKFTEMKNNKFSKIVKLVLIIGALICSVTSIAVNGFEPASDIINIIYILLSFLFFYIVYYGNVKPVKYSSYSHKGMDPSIHIKDINMYLLSFGAIVFIASFIGIFVNGLWFTIFIWLLAIPVLLLSSALKSFLLRDI